MSLFSIRFVLILDSDGGRIIAKYFPTNKEEFSTEKDRVNFEKNLWKKTRQQNTEILMFEKYVVVYKSSADVIFYVGGSSEENELILLSALNSYYECLAYLLRDQVDKRMLIENLDFVLLSLDELVDRGILLEVDANEIAQRTALKSTESDVPLTEQTLPEAWKTAKKHLIKAGRKILEN
eukprot:TRINITY_DN3766_c0_g1_i1.p1 TRINITY_DN3766_c0_g1~~TRINITY_DN3766_c0_g1_i1.p1  ORF type:complete len:180 (-),score=38.68 TRINITY_DN3766_c0_g1_i1:72-611(-)